MDIDVKNIKESRNIIEILQNEVDKLLDEHWIDFCPPRFTVSLLYDKNLRDKEMRQYILLICEHLGSCVSTVVFPIDENFYGYDSLLSVMKDLYNQTM